MNHEKFVYYKLKISDIQQAHNRIKRLVNLFIEKEDTNRLHPKKHST